ncbi:MAG: hypothetical protein ABR569_05165 [Gaiellaceae bacterium]
MVHHFDGLAAYAAHRTPLERELAGADSADIDNIFLEKALDIVPRNSTYALLEPASIDVAQRSYKMAALTYLALPGYVRFLLLPRREMPPSSASYILCYFCDTSPFDQRWTRVWESSDRGLVIGLLRH